MHIELKTHYSFIESLIVPKQIDADPCGENPMQFCAITDSNACGHINFQSTMLDKGVQPIFGFDVHTVHGNAYLYARNADGYKHLLDLISPNNCDITLPKERNTNVACVLPNNASDALIDSCLAYCETLVSVKRTHADDDFLNARMLYKAEQLELKVIAVNNCRFLEQSQYESHDIRYCINSKEMYDYVHRISPYTDQQYLKSEEQMRELFDDMPQVIDNTIEFGKSFDFTIETGKVCLPKISEDAEQDLIDKSWQGFECLDIDPKMVKSYEDRMKYELEVINSMGFASYFLIVADFIGWAKVNNIPVGPGRGSGAGSIVAYALGITNLDPIKYSLLFERFLNPERVSMPDFDIDFCQDRRHEVIEYVRDKWGADKVAQIINFGTLSARAVVNDVNRVLDLRYHQGPKNMAIHSIDSLEDYAPLITEETEDAERICIEEASKIEDLIRQRGVHAAGVVIAPTKLTDFTSYFNDGEGNITHLNMGDVESAGLVKFDFLGLKTLTTISKCVQLIEQNHGVTVDIDKIPLDDPKSFELLKTGKTNGVFQLESPGMQRGLVVPLKPDTLEEMIAMVALYRPGPMQSGMMDSYIERKFGREKVSYPLPDAQHPSLAQCLEPTYGVILYQEQVMQIAQILAGYSLGTADLLRRAMGKKKPEEMAKQRQMFMDGCAEVGRVTPEEGAKIFDAVEKFAGYGFNKSHSAAYALIAYQTLWLKANYPLEFFCATMNTTPASVPKFIDDAKSFDIKVLPPCVSKSQPEFVVEGDAIRYGLEHIKGVGEKPSKAIADAAPYKSIKDFFKRCQKYDKRIMEGLLESRALPRAWEDFAWTQTKTRNQLSKIKRAIKEGEEIEWVTELEEFEPCHKKQLNRLGKILNDHPTDDMRDRVYGCRNLRDLGDGVYAVLVTDVYEGVGKSSGKPYTRITIEDTEGSKVVFPPWGQTMLKDRVYLIGCTEVRDNFNECQSVKINTILQPSSCKAVVVEMDRYADIFDDCGYPCFIEYKGKIIDTAKTISIESNQDIARLELVDGVKKVRFKW
jgi:DNA polymerase-3 subunit alpha